MTGNYRKNAGIVVFNKDKKVLLCQRNDVENSWQFPQGGIENGETPKQAAMRELFEETSVHSVKWVKTLDYSIRYTFPTEIIKKMSEKGYFNIGQEMYWSLFYFCGSEDEIDLHTEVPEFSEYKWSTFDEACQLIVDFKKDVYEQVKNEFRNVIDSFKC